jgi:hypothetical protein
MHYEDKVSKWWLSAILVKVWRFEIGLKFDDSNIVSIF